MKKEEQQDSFVIKSYQKTIAIEDEHLLERRQKLYGEKEDAEKLKKTKFGIALSGGGIRSATINLGFLKTLNKFGILKRADYLSTVSGGGYTGAYVQATLKNKGDFNHLFADEHIEYMRSRGEYLVPGKGWYKKWNTLVLAVGYLSSLLMSWISPIIIVALIYIVYTILGKLSNFEAGFSMFRNVLEGSGILVYSLYFLSGILALHLVSNIWSKYSVGVSRRFNQLESIIVAVGLVWIIGFLITGLKVSDVISDLAYLEYVIAAIILVIAGFFANPNALSFHRFYRNQLADAFLHFTGKYKNVRIKDLFKTGSSDPRDYAAPMPLINTCLNLQSSADARFQGSKASDYFVLSPLYSGAKLTGYVPTDEAPDYKQMTLPAATTISAAAVNPGMGMYSSSFLNIVMTLFNARLGAWVANPLKLRLKTRNIVWWPFYFFYELFALIGTDNRKLNISDGGHIENLGVYELLRRKCRLIISVDAGADPQFTFSDLERLTIRSRNELGLDISFREGETPEDIIRPKPSHGYSEQRFAVADIYHIWEEIVPKDEEGKPILGKDKKKIEVLINYKRIRNMLQSLSTQDQRELKKLVKQLDLQDNVQNLLTTLGLGDEKKRQDVVNDLTSNLSLRPVFSNLLEMLQDVNILLNAKLENKLVDKTKVKEVFRQVIQVIETRVMNLLKVGTFVYVKSSVTAPEGKPQLGDRNSLAYHTYKYKIYHPDFPHESTSDQFFDPVQWESYFQLGQFIGAEVLGDEDLEAFKKTKKQEFSIERLIAHFDKDRSLFIDAETIEQASPQQTYERMEPIKVEAAPAAPVPDMPMSTAADEAEAIPLPQKPDEKVVLGQEVQYKM